MSVDLRREDGVLSTLLAAGMNAGQLAATHGADDDLFYNGMLEQITAVIGCGYGTHTLYRELCSSAALVLVLRATAVRVGEIVFRRTEGVWTFHIGSPLDDATNRGLRRAAQMVTVYANVLQQFEEEWASDANPFWEPSAGIAADEDAWGSLMESIPDTDLVMTAKALFVLAGVLTKWGAA